MTTDTTRIYFFGTNGRPGHYLYSRTGREYSYDALKAEMGLHSLDGAFTNSHGAQGHGHCVHTPNGWTVLAVCDYSDDRRGGCNAAFMTPGLHTAEEMIDMATKYFPRKMERIGPMILTPYTGDPAGRPY